MAAEKQNQEFKREFSEENYAEMADSLNTTLGGILTQNMGGQVIENITLPVGKEVRISHNLKKTPKYRIILRQQGSLIITDGDSAWTNKYIYLKAESVTSSGSFSKDIVFKTNDTINPAVAPSGSFASNGYSLTGTPQNIYGIINTATLNDTFNQSVVATEAVISIIIMRG